MSILTNIRQCYRRVWTYEWMRKALAALGVILWVGALSPEIYINSGLNCILDENGEELSQEDAAEIYGSLFLWRSGQRG